MQRLKYTKLLVACSVSLWNTDCHIKKRYTLMRERRGRLEWRLDQRENSWNRCKSQTITRNSRTKFLWCDCCLKNKSKILYHTCPEMFIFWDSCRRQMGRSNCQRCRHDDKGPCEMQSRHKVNSRDHVWSNDHRIHRRRIGRHARHFARHVIWMPTSFGDRKGVSVRQEL
jgi:hypothetical protein